MDTTIIEFDLAKLSIRHLGVGDLSIDPKETKKIYWIHCNLNNIESLHKIAARIHLPEHVLSACTQENTFQKLSDTEDSLSMQIQAQVNKASDTTETAAFENLFIHLTHNYCFTAAFETVPALVEFMETCQKALRYAKTPCFILFLLFDNVINDYSGSLYSFELITEEMDLKIREVDHNTYTEVVEVKQQIMRIKRNIIAIREILVRISDRKMPVISEQCRQSLHNLSNHTHLVVHETDSLREMLNSILAQIDNSLMQNLNETMRVLTAFAAIFLPLTLITGIYGMNFQWIPELTWKYGYFYALGILVVCAAALLFLFKRKKWF